MGITISPKPKIIAPLAASRKVNAIVRPLHKTSAVRKSPVKAASRMTFKVACVFHDSERPPTFSMKVSRKTTIGELNDRLWGEHMQYE
jgi:hypothetical protein